jgi:hypothetical protein
MFFEIETEATQEAEDMQFGTEEAEDNVEPSQVEPSQDKKQKPQKPSLKLVK